MITSLLIATIVPIALYVVVGVSQRSQAANAKDFFYSSQRVSTQDYANTSVGYALQMAAMFLFAYWGLLYGLGALWTAVFWFVGFASLQFLLPRFLHYHDHPVTLHEYIAHEFGGGRKLQVLAASATILRLGHHDGRDRLHGANIHASNLWTMEHLRFAGFLPGHWHDLYRRKRLQSGSTN